VEVTQLVGNQPQRELGASAENIWGMGYETTNKQKERMSQSVAESW